MNFRRRVKHKLIDMEKSQSWLLEQVKEKTGLFVDNSYLNKIYTGERKAPKIRAAICEILRISDEMHTEDSLCENG